MQWCRNADKFYQAKTVTYVIGRLVNLNTLILTDATSNGISDYRGMCFSPTLSPILIELSRIKILAKKRPSDFEFDGPLIRSEMLPGRSKRLHRVLRWWRNLVGWWSIETVELEKCSQSGLSFLFILVLCFLSFHMCQHNNYELLDTSPNIFYITNQSNVGWDLLINERKENFFDWPVRNF